MIIAIPSAPPLIAAPAGPAMIGAQWACFILAATVVLLLPAWALDQKLENASRAVADAAARWTGQLTASQAIVFARRLRARRWTVPEVTSGLVFVLVTTAGLFSVLVAGNVLGLTRPEAADRFLPWLLGAALMAVIAEGLPRNGQRSWLGIAVVACGIATIVLIAIVKVEATTVAPAEYVRHHPLRDTLLGPLWVLLELALFLGGAVLGHAGEENAVRVAGWLLGLLVEICARALALMVALGAFIIRASFVSLHAVISTLFLPAALCWRALRRRLGTDIDGNDRLPPLPGDAGA